jgi:hypothetical protein
MATDARPPGQLDIPAPRRSSARPISRRTGLLWLVGATLAEFGFGFVPAALFVAGDRICDGRPSPPLRYLCAGPHAAWYMRGWTTLIAVACVGIAVLVVPAVVGVRLKYSGWAARVGLAVALAAELAVVTGVLAGPAFVRWRYPEYYHRSYHWDWVPSGWGVWGLGLVVAAIPVAFVAWVANFVARTTGKPPLPPTLYRSLTDWEA